MFWQLWLLLALDEITKRLAHPFQPENLASDTTRARRRWHVIAQYLKCLYFVHTLILRRLALVRRSLTPLVKDGCQNCVLKTYERRIKGVSLLQLQAGYDAGCSNCQTLLLCASKFSIYWRGILHSDVHVNVQERSANLWTINLKRSSILLPARGHQVDGGVLLSLSVLFGECTLTGELLRGREFGLPVPLRSQSDQCFDFITKRLEHCLLKHEVCNTRQKNPFVPTRLIDTQPNNLPSGAGPNDICLVKGTSLCDCSVHYVALSYCWGEESQRIKPIPKLTSQTMSSRFRHIPWSELTKTFEDGVFIARRLSIRYIWIDALCIQQDDAADFAAESSHLASIYGKAHLVVSATRAATGDIGIFHDRMEPYKVPFIDSRGRASTAYVKKASFHSDFSVNDPTHFRYTPVFSRAWCFQERLLASRVVHFAEAEIVWECNNQIKCECGSLDEEDYHGINFKTRQACRLLPTKTHGDDKSDLEFRESYWNECIHTYTSRHLTYESDRLPAISGYARELHIPAMGRYLAGVWEFQMPSALLWFITHPRLEDKTGQIRRPKDNLAPTWSWVSIDATVLLWHALWRKHIARVIEVSCVPSTPDVFGQIQPDAYLMLDAPVLDVILISYGTTVKQWGRRPCGQIILARDEQAHTSKGSGSGSTVGPTPHDFDADLDISLPNHVDSIAIGSRLFCAIIEVPGRNTDKTPPKCLVLRARSEDDEKKRTGYCRVGLFDCPEPWLVLAEQRRLKIF